jgi:MFS family permease
VLNLPAFEKRFPLSPGLTGTVTGSFELAAFVGALFMALFGKVRGKRDNIALGSCLVAVGAAIQSGSKDTGMLIGGRVVGGVGLGILTSQTAIWQAETAPARIRGRVACASLSFLIVGLNLAYWIDYGMAKVSDRCGVKWKLTGYSMRET